MCHAFFFEEQKLASHKKTVHSRVKRFQCQLCNKSFAFQAGLKTHIDLTHSPQMNDPGNITCNICQTTFSDKRKLYFHYKKMHVKERVQYKCTVCSKIYHAKRLFEIHMRSHTGERPFICSFCPTSFVTKISLKNHTKLHTENRKNYKCQICDERFNTLAEHKMHEKTHPSNFIFSCKTCGKNFTNKNRLNRHEHTHLTVKPYSCDLCTMTFSTYSGMKTHRRTHTRKRDFKCIECGKILFSEAMFKRHMYRHTGIMEFSCSTCNESFPTIEELKRHKHRSHPEQYAKCDICPALFTNGGKMREHLTVHNGTHKWVQHTSPLLIFLFIKLGQ